MELKIQKPIQSDRKRWGCRGSAGVAKERGMCEEKHWRTWETQLVPRLQRGKCDRRKREVNWWRVGSQSSS